MSDSVEEKPTSEKPTTTAIVVRNSDGITFSTRIKDEKGRFQKKEKAMPSTKDLKRWGRSLLNRAEAGPDGKPVKGKQSRQRVMFDRLYEIATKDVDDPKAWMAQIKATELLYLMFHGKFSPGDEEIEALKVSGVKFVVIQPPELVHKEKEEGIREQPEKPAFLDAEVVQQN